MDKVLGAIMTVVVSIMGILPIANPAKPSPSPLKVAGVSTVVTASPTPTATPTPSPKPTPLPIKTSKSSYTIAVFGDSLVDTMGENLDFLDHALLTKYPNVKFKLYNYGIGSQNVEMGLARFHQPLVYKERNFPPIDQINADIIILGSFAYNPFSPYDKERHRQGLISLVEEAKKTGSRVYLMAEIAPLKSGFGAGPNGVNWDEARANEQANNIVEQLLSAIGVASSQGVPLINVYSQSLLDGRFGRTIYVSDNDRIHPSAAGQTLTANIIVQTIKLP
jgi:hypothetical protein